MDTRRIGSLEVSVIGLGCNNFGRRLDALGTRPVVTAALDEGVTFFDTADVYGNGMSEEFLGQALRDRRRDVVIATKFGMPMNGFGGGGRPAYVRRAVEASLARLGTDYIDLYYLHRPDPETPIDDTLGALNGLVRDGKIREFGCSQFSAALLRDAQAATLPGAHGFAAVQNEFSLLHRDPEHDGVFEECWRQALAFVPYFPLASGLLTGKYRRGEPAPTGSRLANQAVAEELLTDANLAVVERLREFAEANGRSLLELALGWLLAHDLVASVIAGAMKPEQVRSNVAASRWQLREADLDEIDRLTLTRTA
jgi:aryl-alcohol dehydrogenase-like predicted oxidoreductase